MVLFSVLHVQQISTINIREKVKCMSMVFLYVYLLLYVVSVLWFNSLFVFIFMLDDEQIFYNVASSYVRVCMVSKIIDFIFFFTFKICLKSEAIVFCCRWLHHLFLVGFLLIFMRKPRFLLSVLSNRLSKIIL